MNRSIVILTAAVMLTMTLPSVLGSGASPVGPVTNGDFESFVVPDEVKSPLQDTPANECIGIGHQVDWGTDSPQHALLGDSFENMPENADPDPERLANRYTGAEDPAAQAQSDAEEQSGYGHCVFSDEKGQDKYWLNPASAGGTTDDDAAAWSEGDHTNVGFGFDDNPFDKEIQVESNPSDGGDHALWQNVFHPGRGFAFSANFDALEFDVEDGSIPDDASVKISLGAEPLNVQERYTVIYIDCVLGFSGTYLQDSLSGDRVSASPVADEVSYDGWDDPDCPTAWNNTSPDERRDALGRLQIVQVSFWDFNEGAAPVVIDNIALPGATTHAEEAADGNFRVCTDVAGTVDDATCSDETVGK